MKVENYKDAFAKRKNIKYMVKIKLFSIFPVSWRNNSAFCDTILYDTRGIDIYIIQGIYLSNLTSTQAVMLYDLKFRQKSYS